MPNFELSSFALLSVVASTTACVVAVALCLVPLRGRADTTWLVVFLSLSALTTFTQAAAELGLIQVLPSALIVFGGLPFLAAPALYQYAAGTIGDEPLGSRILFACGMIGLTLGVLWYRSYVEEGEFFATPGKLLAGGFYALSVAFCTATLWKIRSARKEVRMQFADTSRRTLNWLQLVVGCFAVVLITDAILGFLLASASITLHLAGAVMTTTLTSSLAVISLTSLRQPVLFEHPRTPAATKYASSGLSEARLAVIGQRLDALMRAEQLFLESDLSLASLAERLGTYRHHLSQLLNQTLETNFYEYINGLRVEHAKKLLRNSDVTVLDVAFASGYANKASFYRAFRELCGQTPTQYRKALAALEKQPNPR